MTGCFYPSPAESAATRRAEEAIEGAAKAFPALGFAGFRDFDAEDRVRPAKRAARVKRVRQDRVALRASTHLVVEIDRMFGPSFAAQQRPVSFESVQRAVDWRMGFVVPDGVVIAAAYGAGLVPELRKDKLGRAVFTGRLVPSSASSG